MSLRPWKGPFRLISRRRGVSAPTWDLALLAAIKRRWNCGHKHSQACIVDSRGMTVRFVPSRTRCFVRWDGLKPEVIR
jgi:hypothetical protein